MQSPIIDSETVNALRRLLDVSGKIVITCHLSPDGDAIGSSLGLWHVLRDMGKQVWIVTPDMVPKHLTFLPGVKDVVPYSRYTDRARVLLDGADLIMCLDFNDSKRVDKMEPALLASKARKVMIDHHLMPGQFAEIVISHPEVSSTCMLLYRVLGDAALSDHITRDVAECIYTGMMTDTGNFTYNSNDPDLYVVISELLHRGIDKDRLYKLACNTNSEWRLRLCGYAVSQKMEVFPEHRAALITLSHDELIDFHYEKGDTESLVNQPLSIPTVTWSAFLRDDGEYIKVSMRSKGDFAVNRICQDHFNGGGHRNASGGEFYGTLQEAVDKLKEVMPEYDKYLPRK